MERLVDQLHRDTEEAINKIIYRNISVTGTIEKRKIKKIVDVYMAKEMKNYRKGLLTHIRGSVATSSQLGIRSVVSAIEPQSKLTALKWKYTARKIRNNITNMIGVDGLTLSERVWKISGDSMYHLKKVVSSDILQGNSAAKISRDVRGYLLRPETLRGRAKDLLHPGRGVYKSAYKNAMRVTRTETSRAYIDGQKGVAKTMGRRMQFMLSGAHPKSDICDPLAGNIYEPDAFPAPLHPQCMCWAKTVM